MGRRRYCPGAAGGEQALTGLVTVSIPYHGCPGAVRRAVDAVLAQTETDLVCVVTNDADRVNPPWRALAGIDDPRLVRYDARVNRGRYYADAVVLAACDTEWFTVHDADDQAHPEWLARCLQRARETGADAVWTAQRVVGLRGQRVTEQPLQAVADREMHHFAHMAGLWRTDWLRSVGGPHPGYRIGYDSLLSTIARWYGRLSVIDEPLYTRYRRAGSLTTSKRTGGKSALRRQARASLKALWREVRTAPDAASVGAAMHRGDPMKLRHHVERDAARLRQQIEGAR